LFLPREPRRERARTAATSHRCKSSGKRGNSTRDRRRGRKRKREKRVVAILLKYCRRHISKTKKHTGERSSQRERERGLVLFRILNVVAEGFCEGLNTESGGSTTRLEFQESPKTFQWVLVYLRFLCNTLRDGFEHRENFQGWPFGLCSMQILTEICSNDDDDAGDTGVL
jgi:hypothetical protein